MTHRWVLMARPVELKRDQLAPICSVGPGTKITYSWRIKQTLNVPVRIHVCLCGVDLEFYHHLNPFILVHVFLVLILVPSSIVTRDKRIAVAMKSSSRQVSLLNSFKDRLI